MAYFFNPPLLIRPTLIRPAVHLLVTQHTLKYDKHPMDEIMFCTRWDTNKCTALPPPP